MMVGVSWEGNPMLEEESDNCRSQDLGPSREWV